MTSCKPLSSYTRQKTSKSDKTRSHSSSASNNCSRCGRNRTERDPPPYNHILSWYIPRNVTGEQVPYNHPHDTASRMSSRDNDDERAEETLSPLHDNSKQLWDLKYSDDKVRSLPFPPPHKPKLFEHEVPHANNLTHIFKTTNYPASVLYSRYGIPLCPSPYQVDKFNYHMWSNNPLQSMFAHVGGVQRRHFTVAPDWRHLSHANRHY